MNYAKSKKDHRRSSGGLLAFRLLFSSGIRRNGLQR
jgi:hypothetical protein